MLRAVAFDYRDTLAEFRWDDALWRRGVEALVADAVVLSCEVGVRKPHPRFFAAVVEALGVDPGGALFVGDSMRDDVLGAAAAGMRACLATWYRRDSEAGGRGVTLGTEPLHVLQILEGIVESGRAGKI